MAATGFDTELIARRDAEGTRTMCGALIASLIVSAEARGVGIRAGFGVDDLRRDGDEWVLTCAAGTVTARAVVLASGGFEWNQRLQEAFLPNPVTPISAPSNTGDGLELGLAAGGSVGTMRAVWGVPVLQDPEHVYDGRPSGRMANVELTLPGSIMVNATGRRFVNEAVNYHDLNKVFRTIDSNTGEHANIPAWLMVDSEYISRYSIGGNRSDRCRPGRSAVPRSRSLRRPWASIHSPWPGRSPSSTSSPLTDRTRCSTAARARRRNTWAIPGSRTRAWRRLPRGRFTRSRSGPARWAPAVAW